MRLLLEGPRIEPLLARVKAEHGAAARIVHAERVRTGGVAGFFTRERFQVTIEVPDRADPAATPARTTSVHPVAGAATASDAPVGDGERPAAPTGIDALVAAAEQAERASVPGPAVPQAQPAPTAPAADDVPPAAADGAQRPLSTQSELFAAVLAGLQDRAAASSPAPATSEHPVAPATTSSDATAGFRDRLATAGLPAALLAELGRDAGPAELLDVLRSLPPAPLVPARAGHLVVVVGERREAMTTARRLADRLKLDPADVLVAGRPVDPCDRPQPVGSGSQLTSTDQARQAAAAIREAEVPAVVAVECGFGQAEAGWARQLVAALRPDQVIACVDATRKAADTRSWLRGWCGQDAGVDAVSVHRASATADPGTVLDLGVPVADVDGHDGSASTWLAVLLDRAEPLATPVPQPDTDRHTIEHREGALG